MTFDDFSMLFQFAGGLGMFLYGMKMMANGLQKTAGEKMKHLMGVLTNNRFTAIVVGALITAIIQSSGATTVMVIGFVNASIMSLTQAVGVIMGANIGTTITAWIVSAGQLGELFTALKPEFYAPLMIGVGAFFAMFARKERKQNIGEIFVALGLLFIGLSWMSGAIKPYTDAPIFAQAFTILGSNPLLGIFIGALITTIMQSSSASIGVLQTLAMNGVVTTNAAVYICLGSNIGSCYTAILSSIGASKNAKRAAAINLLFNCFGVILFGTVAVIIFLINKKLASSMIDSVQISTFHTAFNLINTVIMFPLANFLVKISGMLVKDKVIQEESIEARNAMEWHLDDRIMRTPSFAIEATADEVLHMGKLATDNIKLAVESTISHNEEDISKVFKMEQTINQYEKRLTEYLVKINNLSLTDHQHKVVKNLMYTINDLERVGDHAENVVELAESMIRDKLSFSEDASQELKEMNLHVIGALEDALQARKKGNLDYVVGTFSHEEKVDELEDNIRERYILRLSRNECCIECGVIFMDIISNLERVSDHAVNIAEYVQDEK